MIRFGRAICGDEVAAERREWLVTNGLGGFASGTIAGSMTRRYHGLLFAAMRPPGDRKLLVSKLDEEAFYLGQQYALYTNHWAGNTGAPAGFQHIERFYLAGTRPVWEFSFGDALLEKQIWMQQGANTTYVRYHLIRSSAPVRLEMRALVNFRPLHGETQNSNSGMQIGVAPGGLKINAFDGALPVFLLSDFAHARPAHIWHHNFFLKREAERGLPSLENHLHAGTFTAQLQPGDTLTFIATTDPDALLDGEQALYAQQEHENRILALARCTEDTSSSETQLVLAADQFVVQRKTGLGNAGTTIIAGYPWFGDWGRDTMISLPGLTLATGRPDRAADILKTFAGYVRDGLLPNHFPNDGEDPEYNTVDAALWYIEAVRAYHQATGDDELVRALYPLLTDIIQQYSTGTHNNIHVDPTDGLLFAGITGKQLTWMDAKTGDHVVTPRIGKPVEINALWFNALLTVQDFAGRLKLKHPASTLAKKARRGFARFWNFETSCCHDVLDGPDGNDPRMRPNQIFAVSLPYSPLSKAQQRQVVDAVGRELLTSHGLRSLGTQDPEYTGKYGGSPDQRDRAYHQGTAWAWLTGPYARAHYRVYNDAPAARRFLLPLIDHLSDHGLGSISEIFDGDPPFHARGTIAQAWSVAEWLWSWRQLI